MKTFCSVIVLLGVFGSSCRSEETMQNATLQIAKSVYYNCGPNAVYIKGGPACDTACISIMELCNRATLVPENGCYCRPGFARDDKNICIPIQKCSSQIGKCCGRYEIYYMMGKAPSDCQYTCKTLGTVCNIRPIVASSGCYCIPGYVRARDGGDCIPQNQCPV